MMKFGFVLRLTDDQEVMDSERHHLTYKDGEATLHISDLEPVDAGSYTCLVSNGFGHVRTSANLQVEGKQIKFLIIKLK